MPVYMIRAGEHGPVKIGYADCVEMRLVKMQADNHERLAVMRLLQGGQMEEAALHERFRANHLHGEWFSWSAEMLGDVGLQNVVGYETKAVKRAKLRLALAAPPRDPTIIVDPILDEIEKFIVAVDMAPVTFGMRAAGDPHFVRDLRAGRELRRRTRKRIAEFIKAQTVALEQVAA